jgi:hypothetical protein
MVISWENLCSGLFGSMIGAAISWALYYKQRNDQLIETLQVKLSEQLAIIAKIKHAERYTKNSINRVDYVYHCTLLDDIDNMCKYLDLLIGNEYFKTQIITTINESTTILSNELNAWQSYFKKEQFTSRRNFLAQCAPEVATRTSEMYLTQDIHSLHLRLSLKEKEFIRLEEKFINLSKSYIAKMRWWI